MDRMDKETRGADEKSMDMDRTRDRDKDRDSGMNVDRLDAKQDRGSCSCGKTEAEHTRHRGMEGPDLPKSDETKNRSQDEGKTYDV